MEGTLLVDDAVFRAYDVRGIYPHDINERFSYAMGRAFGTFAGEGRRVAVGMDVRESSPALKQTLVRGIVDSGVDVSYIGVTPTPTLYFAIAHYGLDGGIAVSASHNPPEWNGFKVCGRSAKVIGMGFGLEDIRDIMKSGRFNNPRRKGEISDVSATVLGDYASFVFEKVRFGDRKVSMGIDPGNGACAGFAAEILSKSPVRLSAINDTRDGRFPSRPPEPKPETIGELRRFVTDNGLDLGVAFDGDGDRAIFVDEGGNVIYGDRVLALLVKHMVGRGERVVYEVSCSDAVGEVIRDAGCTPVMTRVGHQYIEHAMLGENAAIGGEISGHLYFRETYGFDDAFFAAAKIASLMSDSDRKLSELVAGLPRYETYVREFEADDNTKFTIIDTLRRRLLDKYDCVTIDGVKARTAEGWFIVRASNTSPKIKVVAEARDKTALGNLERAAEDELGAAYAEAGFRLAR